MLIAEEILLTANRAKYLQNQRAMDILMSTGENILAEASPDRWWGIGFRLGHPNANNKHEWQGKNAFGNILMKLREEFAAS